jgi:hypothetical protein
MARSRGSRNATKEEDVSGLAGWLFTDLLLGLSFVFLAIASPFVIGQIAQADADTAEPAAPCVELEMTYFPKPLRIAYSNRDRALSIVQDIERFASEQEPPLRKVRVAVALIQGPYQPGERASDGQEAAFEFYKKLVEVNPENFPDVPGFAQKDTKESNVRFIGAPVGQGDPPVPPQGAFVELFFLYDPSTCD